MTYVERLLKRVRLAKPDECWEWTGARGAYGYGNVRTEDGRKTTAHRAMYVALNGDVDPALDIDHKCRNRLCVNPAHLEAITHHENLKRGSKARGTFTHCKRGHKKERVTPSGKLRCRECIALAGRMRRARAKQPDQP